MGLASQRTAWARPLLSKTRMAAFLEDGMDIIASVPSEVQRTLSLVRELDGVRSIAWRARRSCVAQDLRIGCLLGACE